MPAFADFLFESTSAQFSWNFVGNSIWEFFRKKPEKRRKKQAADLFRLKIRKKKVTGFFCARSFNEVGKTGKEERKFQPNEQTLQGPFSSVSTPNFATKYALESSWRDLQDLHAFTPLRPQYFRKCSSNLFAFLANFANHYLNSFHWFLLRFWWNFVGISPIF